MTDENEDGFGVTLQVRARHADLHAAAKKMGGQAALARHLGVEQSRIGEWCNLKAMPKLDSPKARWTTDPAWRADIEKKLFELTGKTLDELFPQDIRDNVEFLASPKTIELDATISGVGIGHVRPLALPGADAAAIQSEARDAIAGALKTLSSREREIIKLRFGLDGDEPKTLEECGKVFGVTKDRIRQIEAKGLRKLQQPSRHHKLQDFVDVEFSPA